MTDNPEKSQTIIQAAMEAMRRGDKATARQLARQAAALEPGSETPWLILAAVSSPEASLAYARQALQINPQSKKAQQALEWAQERMRQEALETKPAAPPEPAPTQPEAASAALAEELALPGEPKKRLFSPAVILIFGALGLAALALFASLAFLAPRLTNLFRTPAPTLPCGQPTISIGPLVLRIETISLEDDGSLPKIPQKAGRAYWVAGTQPNYLFLLPQVRQNLDAIPSLPVGTPLVVTWADCGQEAFVVKTVGPRNPFEIAQVDQSASGATLVLPVDSTGTVILVTSGWQELPQAPLETPEPNAVQAEINFLETSISEDGTTLTQVIEIKNTGSSPILLSPGDISLSFEGGSPQGPLSTAPALPTEIPPGQSLPVTITFAKPPTNTAVFQVLDFSVDLYY